MLRAKVHSAKVMDYEGIKSLLRRAHERFPRLSHLWLDAGHRGEDNGADWVEKTLEWNVEIVQRPKKLAPEEVLMRWAAEWAKEGGRLAQTVAPKGSMWCCRGGGWWSGHCHGSSSKGG